MSEEVKGRSNDGKAKPPRVFISYSWSSQDHEQWVVDMAERLVGDGVDVVLDKWELRHGQDKYAYMERMVTDPTVTKVVAFCDRVYAEKSDGKRGGVGTESQIISREVYEQVSQTKFIPVLLERGEAGEEILPTFFAGRMYIDMSSPERELENYDQLLRMIFDRPRYNKPALGKPPAHLFEDAPPASKTRYKLELLKRAVAEDRGSVGGLVADYLKSYSAAMEDFRLTYDSSKDGVDFDERVVAGIEAFKPQRDEFVDFISSVALYRDDAKTYGEIFNFFQDILQYRHKPPSTSSWHEIDFDNYRFILWELFLYTMTVLIKNERFEHADTLLSRPYLDRVNAVRHGQANGLVSYGAFDAVPQSLEEIRKRRLQINRRSVTAALLHERAYHPEYDFDSLMQTDLILFLRSALNREQMPWGYDHWYPRTLGYAEYGAVFDLFIKAASKSYFRHLALLLKVDSKQDLEAKLDPVIQRTDSSSSFMPRGYTLKYLTNLDALDAMS